MANLYRLHILNTTLLLFSNAKYQSGNEGEVVRKVWIRTRTKLTFSFGPRKLTSSSQTLSHLVSGNYQRLNKRHYCVLDQPQPDPRYLAGILHRRLLALRPPDLTRRVAYTLDRLWEDRGAKCVLESRETTYIGVSRRIWLPTKFIDL